MTKGDYNQNIDQISSLIDSDRFPIEPVKFDWVVGKAEGELPWFGLIKLYTSGVAGEEGKTPPPTSVNMLILSIVLIIIIISGIHILFLRLERKRRRKLEAEREKKLIPCKKKIQAIIETRPSPRAMVSPGETTTLELEEVSKDNM